MSPGIFANFKSDVSRAGADMFGIADSKVDMANIRTTDLDDAEMVCRHESLGWIPGNDASEAQPNVTEGQIIRWDWPWLAHAPLRPELEDHVKHQGEDRDHDDRGDALEYHDAALAHWDFPFNCASKNRAPA